MTESFIVPTTAGGSSNDSVSEPGPSRAKDERPNLEQVGPSTDPPTEMSTRGSSSINKRGMTKQSTKKRKIRKLEHKLKILDKHIKKYNEVELSLEEMNNGTSAYMKEDLYKRKFVATWQELCELNGVPDNIEVVELNGTATYCGTHFPEINRRVQRLIKLDEFPDHFDIVELIERCNDKHNLCISADEKKTLSRKIFKDVGKILKDKRQRDFIFHFGCHLTDSVKLEEDPALGDEMLSMQLQESLRESQVKMEKVCEEYVTKQEQDHTSESGKSPNNSDNDDEGSKEEENDFPIDDLDGEVDTSDGEGSTLLQQSLAVKEVSMEAQSHHYSDDDNELNDLSNSDTEIPPTKKKRTEMNGVVSTALREEESEGSSICSGYLDKHKDSPNVPCITQSTVDHNIRNSTTETDKVICIDSGTEDDEDDEDEVICIG